MSQINIKELSIREAEDLTYSADKGENGKYKPLGLFITKTSSNEFVAYDNTTGDCWADVFSTREAAIKWLELPTSEMESKRKFARETWDYARKILFEEIIAELRKNNEIGSSEEAANIVEKLESNSQ